jgi:hypothetical protein
LKPPPLIQIRQDIILINLMRKGAMIVQSSCCGTKATGPTKLNSKTPYCGTLEEQQLPRHHIQEYFNQIIGGLMTQ